METIKTAKDFDCIKMKNDIQAQIYAETKGMNFEDLRAYMAKRIANSPFKGLINYN